MAVEHIVLKWSLPMDEITEKYITVDPDVQHGKPCFRGTRIPVYVVLELLEGGSLVDQIVGPDYYPNLSREHVKAALHFAAEYAKTMEYGFFRRSA
jgi:uncharacterized protein (DUF433 family)